MVQSAVPLSIIERSYAPHTQKITIDMPVNKLKRNSHLPRHEDGNPN